MVLVLVGPADLYAHIDDEKRPYNSFWWGMADTAEILAILGADNSATRS
jgi:hypothetical protein